MTLTQNLSGLVYSFYALLFIMFNHEMPLTSLKKEADSCILQSISSQCSQYPFESSYNLNKNMHELKTNHHIVIYTKDHCPYCVIAKELLEKKHANFEEINLSIHPELITEMIEKSGRKTVPQIFINHQSLGGCDDLYDLESNGKLDSLLS